MKKNTSTHSQDVEVIGNRTKFRAVLGNESGNRGWLRGMPECPQLGKYHIAHTGILEARSPYEIVRIFQSGTFMLACLSGEGVILVDGAWKLIHAGQACLLPPFVTNSLKCVDNKPWNFAWVRYEESNKSKPVISSISPVVGPFDASGLANSIDGLHHEATGENQPSALHHWCELIHHYVIRFAEPSHLDERLSRVWFTVEKNPAHAWTLVELALLACMSPEHLRRLCIKDIGRTPMRHLTFIRLQRAMNLVTTTNDKLESIAKEVGFSCIQSFTLAFKERFGRSPSKFR
jgi:AraC-like DNA-binding protein